MSNKIYASMGCEICSIFCFIIISIIISINNNNIIISININNIII